MAPSVVVSALLTVTAALLAPLLLSPIIGSLPSAVAAASSPAPSPAPAPAPEPAPAPYNHWPAPRPHRAASSGNNKNRGRPPAVQPVHPPHPPRAAPPTVTQTWWRRLNFGERFGIALAGVAVAAQVALGAFLLLASRARQLRRAAAAGEGGGASA